MAIALCSLSVLFSETLNSDGALAHLASCIYGSELHYSSFEFKYGIIHKRCWHFFLDSVLENPTVCLKLMHFL